jgi:hypothetical protein
MQSQRAQAVSSLKEMSVALIDEAGIRVIYDAWADQSDGGMLPGDPGTYEAKVTLPGGLLRPGRYLVEVWVGTELEAFLKQEVLSLKVAPRSDDRQEWIDRRRAVAPSLNWRVRREPFEP